MAECERLAALARSDASRSLMYYAARQWRQLAEQAAEVEGTAGSHQVH